MSSEDRSQGAYVICQHPDHVAVAEIFTVEEYRKILCIDGAYRILWAGNSWDEAVEHLRQTIEKVYEKDPTLVRLKHDMEEVER